MYYLCYTPNETSLLRGRIDVGYGALYCGKDVKQYIYGCNDQTQINGRSKCRVKYDAIKLIIQGFLGKDLNAERDSYKNGLYQFSTTAPTYASTNWKGYKQAPYNLDSILLTTK